MNMIDQACGACGNAFASVDVFLRDGKPVCSTCRLGTTTMTPKEVLVRQAVSIALRERNRTVMPFACARFLLRLRRQGDIWDALPEAKAAMVYVFEHGQSPPMLREKTA